MPSTRTHNAFIRDYKSTQGDASIASPPKRTITIHHPNSSQCSSILGPSDRILSAVVSLIKSIS